MMVATIKGIRSGAYGDQFYATREVTTRWSTLPVTEYLYKDGTWQEACAENDGSVGWLFSSEAEIRELLRVEHGHMDIEVERWVVTMGAKR